MSERLSEFDLIAKLLAPLATSPDAFGLKDDVAMIAPRAGYDLVVTTDAIVEGLDFFASDPPDTIARKALRVNLSDLAAKGADPAAYLLTLLLPEKINDDFLKSFAAGLAQDQKTFGIALLGGDMSATPGPLSISITAFGHVPKGQIVRRNGACVDDLVFVTGTIGDSGGGLAQLKSGMHEPSRLIERYRVPEPRIGFAPLVRVASASIDVSDGLLADLGHIAEASGVRIIVEADKIPCSPEVMALWGKDAIVRAATAGDDYEIAFTSSSQLYDGQTRVTCIGRVEKGAGVALIGRGGGEIDVPRKGFRHF